MSELNRIAGADASDTGAARRAAVVAAMELIKADVGAGGARAGSALGGHMDNLGQYADRIQAAVIPSE